MNNQVVVLPIGGTASRMLGLPKSLLPISSSQTLVSKHIEDALKAGYEKVVVILRAGLSEIYKVHFAKYGQKLQIVELDHDTQTMSETLRALISKLPELKNQKITCGLPDSFFWCKDNVYEIMFAANHEYTMGCFRIRDSQRGKLGEVLVDSENSVLSIMDKSLESNFELSWGILKFPGSLLENLDPKKPHIGFGFEELLANGISLFATIVNADYYDCGTFEEYQELICRL